MGSRRRTAEWPDPERDYQGFAEDRRGACRPRVRPAGRFVESGGRGEVREVGRKGILAGQRRRRSHGQGPRQSEVTRFPKRPTANSQLPRSRFPKHVLGVGSWKLEVVVMGIGLLVALFPRPGEGQAY